MKVKAIILSAGKGTRFKSEKPKVLHEILGKPMLFYVKTSAQWINPDEIIFVVGHKKEQVKQYISCDRCTIVEQDNQLGTGHAVQITLPHWKDFDGFLIILNGDTPLIKGQTLKDALEYAKAMLLYEGANMNSYSSEYKNEKFAGVVLTAKVPNPYGYGRIIKDENGKVIKIVEEKDASLEEKRINEVNSGIYIFYAPFLKEVINRLDNKNAQNEYYLTDVITLLKEEGKEIYALEIPDYTEILGVNDRWQLAYVENILKMQYLQFWALNGTTFHNPESIWVEFDVEFSKDVEVFQNCVFKGNTKIGENTVIEPNCIIKNSKIGKNVKILANSVIEDSVIEDGAVVGPFARLRQKTVIKQNAVIGNFVEVKKSTIGENTNARHLTYIGDATVGKDVNIGAGTITCNYDGFKKYQTIIKDKAFIGSDTMLVAPITIGEEAMTASGSVITKDVPPKALAIERAPLKIIENYVEKRRKKFKNNE